MPGANYMGGQRNAMKTRSKDIVSRLRKNHFGKQKLSMLSNVLASPLRTLTRSTRPLFNLNHARRDQLNRFGDETESSVSRIPPPVFPSDLRSDSSSGDASSTLSKGRSAKLLRSFDLLEPISYAAKRQKLLQKLDFSGLKKKNTVTAFGTSNDRSPSSKRWSFEGSTEEGSESKALITSRKLIRHMLTIYQAPCTPLHVSEELSSHPSSVHSSRSSTNNSSLYTIQVSSTQSDPFTYASKSGDAEVHAASGDDDLDIPAVKTCYSDSSDVSSAMDQYRFNEHHSMMCEDEYPGSDRYTINPAQLTTSSEWNAFTKTLDLPRIPLPKIYVNAHPSHAERAGVDFYELSTPPLDTVDYASDKNEDMDLVPVHHPSSVRASPTFSRQSVPESPPSPVQVLPISLDGPTTQSPELFDKYSPQISMKRPLSKRFKALNRY
ncbi:hypothetical protein M422DRAFT_50447 [Sphaerobolus stellatus SS14]|uniref:Uncharacterized protein n=1 Tax=Sphaerobolus stellatus (strain SS14) TaxID=990650 RepID=A0A0C9U3F9_SPHS4|nr:hypothetical protein M422DRAFT_50447 [Sphaerobolus stellatus SS14]